MKHVIPNNPVLLAVLLGKIQAGDDKHQQDKPLPKEVRAELDAAKSELDSLNTSVQLSKGQYRTSSQKRRDYVTKLEPTRFVDAVYAKVGHKDEVLVDYSLAVRRKAHRGAEGTSPTAVSKAERAKVHLARMKAQLDRANERRAALAARISRKEAEVASAPEVTPPEPQSTHRTPSTGTT